MPKLEVLKDIIVKTMVEVLGVFAIMTTAMEQGRASELITDDTFSVTDRDLERRGKKILKALMRKKDPKKDPIEAALSRMNGLTSEEVVEAIAQIRSNVDRIDHGSSSSESNLEAFFEASLDAYEEKTKVNLRTHPLMAELETRKSPDDTLALLDAQVENSEKSTSGNSPPDRLALLRVKGEEFKKSTSEDIRWTKWLKPIVHVLHAFSSVMGAGAGLVNLICMILLRSIL